jgi:hypothetical protein
MIPILTINVIMIALAVAIASSVLPAQFFSGAIVVLHKTIGITLPTPDKERAVAVIWIASLLIIGDVILFLLVFFAGTIGKS